MLYPSAEPVSSVSYSGKFEYIIKPTRECVYVYGRVYYRVFQDDLTNTKNLDISIFFFFF